MFSSKQQVTCFYCDWSGRKDKAKEHCARQHPGKLFKLKFADNNMEKFFKKRTPETDTATDVVIDDEQELQSSDIVSPSPSSVFDSNPSPMAPALVSTSPMTYPVNDQLLSISKQLAKLTDTIEQMNLDKAKSKVPSFSQSDDVEQLFENIKCSNHLYSLKYMEINNQLDTITCVPCAKFKKHAAKHLLSTIKSSFGLFEYIEQDETQVQTQRFRNLKRNLKQHYFNKLHIWCVEEDEKQKQLFDDFVRKNEKAGLNVGRAALFCIRNGLGGLKFIDTLNLMDLSGASIGTYRHSRWFFEKIRTSMAITMKNRIIEYLHSVDPITNRHRPFGITFDKVTLLKRSMQVTILIIMIDGVLTPLYLQSPLCQTELAGEELAGNCVRVLESFKLKKPALREQFTGCAVDGAYIHLQIEKHLCQKLGMREKWLTVSWDSAHLLELAINDAKKQKKISWLQTFIKTCSALMTTFSYRKKYEYLLEAAELIEEQILQPKQFNVTRFVQSERRVYETILRDWSTLYYLQEQDNVINSFAGGDLSTRTRQNIGIQHETSSGDNISYKHDDIKSVDFVCKLIGLNDIYNILVRASMSVQQVNKYPWEHDDSVRRLQQCLNGYIKLLEQLDLNKTQEMDSLEECEEEEPGRLGASTTDDNCDIQEEEEQEEEREKDEEEDEEIQAFMKSSTTYMEQYYQDLLKCEFRQRPIIRRPADYELDDPTTYARRKLIELCEQLVETIATRFRNIPSIFTLMKNCLDVSRLYQQVVSTSKQTASDYGRVELQGLIDYTMLNSEYIHIDSNAIQDQYSEWKQRLLHEIEDKDILNVWTKDGELVTSKVMKTFYTNGDLSNGIGDFLHFHSLMILKIRSEAVCESAASILKGHIHVNRSLHHDSLDNEVMVHRNAPPLHFADSFIQHSLDDYFSHKKEKNWLFYKKSEQYQAWKLISPGSIVLNRLRKEQVPRLPESIHDQ